jgi:hypothetical protein
MELELNIEYDMSLQPRAARCSVCKQRMPLMESKLVSGAEVLKWFQIQFELHKLRKHPVK